MVTSMMAMLFGQDTLDIATAYWTALRRRLLGRPAPTWHAGSVLLDAGGGVVACDGTIGHCALTFTVLLSAQPDGGCLASVPALPEIVTEGDTPLETLAMAQEAIRALLAYCAGRGVPVTVDPRPLVCRITVCA